jgi:hypothetical protein
MYEHIKFEFLWVLTAAGLLLPELWSDDKEAFMGVYFDG